MARKLRWDRINWMLVIGVVVFVGAALLVLWLVTPHASTAGPRVVSYGLWKFTKEGNFWVTQYDRNGQLYNLNFRYLPQNVTDIPVTGTTATLTPPFYLSFDTSMSNQSKAVTRVAFVDSTQKLVGIYGSAPRSACTNNATDPECTGYPSITCSSNVSAIVFSQASSPSLTLNGSCIHIEGSGEDIYRAENLMWYRLLGIVKQ